MIKKLYNALFSDIDILFFDEDSANVTFSSEEMGIFSSDLNNINFDDANFYEDDPKTTIHVRLLACIVYINNAKHLKKISKELMSVVWHSRRGWDWCMSEDEEKEIE